MTTQSAVGARNILRYGTSTVGVITALGPTGVNVMSAEWTYLVARNPPHFAIGCQISNHSTGLILERGEFGLTLCDASMAPLANFAGSFTGAEIDKSRISGVRLADPVAIATPTVDGGTLRAECRVVNVVDLPDYKLIIGEALHLTVDDESNVDPLVKHGGMFRLGEEILSKAITAAATRLADGSVRVCASVQGAETEEDVWTISLGEIELHSTVEGEDLDVIVRLPEPGDHLVVARTGCRSARVALPPV